jgi:hypothetical protein
MSPGDKNALVASGAGIFMLVFVFAKPLGIPSPWDFLPAGAGFVCFYLFFRGNKKIQSEQLGEPALTLPLAARKRRFWLIAVALIVGSIACIPLLPYMVDNFTPGLYFYVVPATFISLSFLLLYLWKKLVDPAKSPK